MKNNQTKYVILIILGFLLSFYLDDADAGVHYTKKQINSLQLARAIGELYDIPETIQGIILQESSACTQKLGDDGESLGCAHVTVPAAKDVLTYCKSTMHKKDCSLLQYYYRDDQRLRVDLAINDSFNIVVAALYFKMQYDRYKKCCTVPWSRALIDYNGGPGKASSMSEVKVYNSAYRHNVWTRIRNIRKVKKSGAWI